MHHKTEAVEKALEATPNVKCRNREENRPLTAFFPSPAGEGRGGDPELYLY